MLFKMLIKQNAMIYKVETFFHPLDLKYVLNSSEKKHLLNHAIINYVNWQQLLI